MPRHAVRPVTRAFTLIELLVVISIIVILLALLVGGLEKALKAAERAKCGTQQRSLANTSAQYALEYDRTLPPATSSSGSGQVMTYSNNVRINGDHKNPATVATLAVGLGNLVVAKRLPETKLGEVINCPSLDTTSGFPVKVGMDEEASADPGNNTGSRSGGSFWTTTDNLIYSSYYYRAKSYYTTHGNGTIRTNIANSSFLLTSDMVTTLPNPATFNYGRPYHHITGWNISRGDGSAGFVEDEEGPVIRDNAANPPTALKRGYVERVVIGGYAAGFASSDEVTAANQNRTPYVQIDGTTKPYVDEVVFKYLGRR